MATNYCSSDDVANFLQMSAVFDTGTKPTKAQVESIINMNEDYIDDVTHHGWREKTISNEMHHLQVEDIYWRYYTGITVFFNHRKIKTIDKTKDKLEIWDGSQWENYAVTRIEGTDQDYWIDYENGIFFVRTRPIFLPRPFSVKLTYRYGDDSKADVKKCCILLTCADLIMSEDRSVLLPEGTSNVSYTDKINLWKSEAEKILENRKEISIMRG